VPTTECERDELFEAKLGKKEIEFSTLEMDANAFREVLYEAYPKLRDGGGFQLCRCIPNSRELEPLSRHVLSSPRLLKERVGQARTYIVPLQRDLDVTPSVDIPEEVTEACLSCGLILPVSELPDHIQECEKALDGINPKRKPQSPDSDDADLSSSPPISPTLPPVSIVSRQQLSFSSGTASQQPSLSSGITSQQPSLSSGVTSQQPSLSSGVSSQQPYTEVVVVHSRSPTPVGPPYSPLSPRYIYLY